MDMHGRTRHCLGHDLVLLHICYIFEENCFTFMNIDNGPAMQHVTTKYIQWPELIVDNRCLDEGACV